MALALFENLRIVFKPFKAGLLEVLGEISDVVVT